MTARWTQSIAKRLDEIKAIKKAMLEAAEKGTKKVEDPVKVFNQQKIISLLLACNIEVITETLDNFKSAGVTVAGDLTQFNTPESLDEAVDDITLEDARKLLKLCVPLSRSCLKRHQFDLDQMTVNVSVLPHQILWKNERSYRKESGT